MLSLNGFLNSLQSLTLCPYWKMHNTIRSSKVCISWCGNSRLRYAFLVVQLGLRCNLHKFALFGFHSAGCIRKTWSFPTAHASLFELRRARFALCDLILFCHHSHIRDSWPATRSPEGEAWWRRRESKRLKI